MSSFGMKSKESNNNLGVVKITNINLEDESREASIYRSPFHMLYDEGDFIGEVR